MRHTPRAKLTGTAGFGFWNDPFLMTELRTPALPRALVFLCTAVGLCGWRLIPWPPAGGGCSTRCAWTQSCRPLAALAPAMHSTRLYRRLWPFFERRFRIVEQLLDVEMTAWHEYVVDWQPESATFLVDGHSVLVAPRRGPLGLVIWIDNLHGDESPWTPASRARQNQRHSGWKSTTCTWRHDDMKTSNFWADDYPRPADLTGSELPDKMDVVVVGGGYTGLHAAIALRKAGAAVVLDQETIGWAPAAATAAWP